MNNVTSALADPRAYGPGDPAESLLQQDASEPELTERVRARLKQGDVASVRRALMLAPSRERYCAVWIALCRAVERGSAEMPVTTQFFAMPWILVCGARKPVTLPGVVRDVHEFGAVLQSKGALGALENVGFSNALCSLETLELLGDALGPDASAAAMDELQPAPIVIPQGAETVHLRFLVGAAVTAAGAPGVVETAANVGSWGMPATRWMKERLAVPDADVLPLPRPPLGVLRAAHAGRRAALELAYTLFLSNTVKRYRMGVGDPTLLVSAHEGGEIRVTAVTPFDNLLNESFRWPLHPVDDLGDIVDAITALAGECRIPDVRLLAGVLPDRTSTGAVFLPALDAAPTATH